MSRKVVSSSASIVPFDAPPYRGLLESDVERVLRSQVLTDPEMRARGGLVLSENRYRVTSRVAVKGGRALLVKVHHAKGLGERLLSFVKPSKARTEWTIARHLSAMGLPVPRPFAYGEARVAGTVKGAFFVGEYIEGVKRLDEAMLEDQPLVKRRALLARVACLIRAMHDRGFDHRDLHAGNILVRPGPGDLRRMMVIDLHRASIGRVVRPAHRLAGLAKWLHSMQQHLGPGERWRLVQAYLGRDASRARLRRTFAAVETRRDRLHRRWLRSRAKRCFKESSRYTRDVGAGVGYRSRQLTLKRLDAVLHAHEAALALDDKRVAKRGRKGLVTRHGDLVVKETIPADFLGRLKDRLAPNRHKQGYANAHRMAYHGVRTAEARAFLRRRGRVFSIFEDVSAFARLDLLARELFGGPDREAARQLLDTSAAWLGRLHRRGIYHGDLKGVNIRVDRTGARPALVLIDMDALRVFRGAVDERRRIKNLSQLAASIAQVVSRTDRLRWFRRYLVALGTPMDTRSTAQAVAAELAKKIVVVDEPIE